MPNRSLLRFSETITLHGFFTPHLGIIRRMNVLYHLFEILVSMGNAATSMCLCCCRIPPKCLFETEDNHIFNSRKASFVWELSIPAHLEPAEGQRGQSFQICLLLRPLFLILRKPTNDTAEPLTSRERSGLIVPQKSPACNVVVCFFFFIKSTAKLKTISAIQE